MNGARHEEAAEPLRLSEYLSSHSLVRAALGDAAAALRAWMTDVDVESETPLASWAAILEYLLPIRASATRYVLLDLGGWCLILANDRFNDGHSVAAALAERLETRSVSCNFYDDNRLWIVTESGREVRAIGCYGAPRWIFSEQGRRLDYEDQPAYENRIVGDRLTPGRIHAYLESETGHAFPLPWRTLGPVTAVGLARSSRRVQGDMQEIPTIDDL